MKIIKSILVPTDFSDLSLTAMEYAKTFSIIFNTRIYLIHVVEDITVLAFHTAELNPETALRDKTDKAGAELNEFLANKFPGDNNIALVVRRGEAYREIIKFAQEERIDLIVLSTHGRTGLSHLLMGSVAEKVVRHSTVPVLTVKPEKLHEKLLASGAVEEQLHSNG